MTGHILLIRVEDKDKPRIINPETGRTFIPTKWLMVDSVNLGSKKRPNKDIIEFKIIPEDEIRRYI